MRMPRFVTRAAAAIVSFFGSTVARTNEAIKQSTMTPEQTPSPKHGMSLGRHRNQRFQCPNYPMRGQYGVRLVGTRGAERAQRLAKIERLARARGSQAVMRDERRACYAELTDFGR
jgi:hypothetical protein